MKLKFKKLLREKKRKKVGEGFSVSTLGFLPRIREVRRLATSVVSPPDLRERFINLSSTSIDDSEHPRSR